MGDNLHIKKKERKKRARSRTTTHGEDAQRNLATITIQKLEIVLLSFDISISELRQYVPLVMIEFHYTSRSWQATLGDLFQICFDPR